MRARSPRRDVSAHHAFAATPLLFSTFKTYLFKRVGVGFSAYWAGHLSVPDLCGQSQRVTASPAAFLLSAWELHLKGKHARGAAWREQHPLSEWQSQPEASFHNPTI